MIFLRVRVAILTIGAALFCPFVLEYAGASDDFFTPLTGAYNDNNNWSDLNVPAAAFEQRAVIDFGSTATLTTAAPNPGGVVLGLTLGQVGTLNINAGGSLTSVPSVSTDGVVNVGIALGGTGTLNMTGGTLNANAGLRSDGNALNVINLSGSAVMNTNSAQLSGTTRLTGSGVNFQTNNLAFQGGSNLIAGITAATHSRVKATGVATIGGTFNVDFTGGIYENAPPAFGQKFDIVDAAAIAGIFDNGGSVGVTGVPAPALGEVYRVSRGTGGTYGQLLQVSREQALVLQVNRDTGAMSILNPLNGPISIDAYQVRSPLAGSIAPAGWISLQDQTTPGWQEGLANGNSLGELNVASTLNFSGVPSKSIGTPYNEGNAFFTRGIGGAGNDLVFTYSDPNLPNAITGTVQYIGTGRTNTLLLSINPTTGAATLKNDAPGTITLEGYSILSNATALLPGGFNDAATPTLTSVAPTTSAISELITNPNSPLAIAGNATYSLGNIFNTASLQEGITLEFAVPGQSILYNGVVRFETPVVGLAGDYNGDNVVNAADYTLWRNHLGEATEASIGNKGDGGGITASDYTYWKARFGNVGPGAGAGGVAVAVPEPASCMLLVMGIMIAAIRIQGRRA